MNTIETIRAEIERRTYNAHEMPDSRPDKQFYEGKDVAYGEILAFLDTLPEQPVVKKSNVLFDKCVENCDPAVMKEVSDNVDKILGRNSVTDCNELEQGLEEEIDKYFRLWRQGASDEGCINADSQFVSIYDCHRIARHFYELGCTRTTEMYDDIEYNRQKAEEAKITKGLDTTEDFVEEVRQYYSNNCTWDALKQPMLSIITRCARHFAEWGAEHLKR